MSEEQKPVMGPKRLFFLLALGAVVFYFLSTMEEAPKTEMEKENIVAAEDYNTVQNELSNSNEVDANKIENNDKKIYKKEADAKDLSYNPNHRLDYDPNHILDYDHNRN